MSGKWAAQVRHRIETIMKAKETQRPKRSTSSWKSQRRHTPERWKLGGTGQQHFLVRIPLDQKTNRHHLLLVNVGVDAPRETRRLPPAIPDNGITPDWDCKAWVRIRVHPIAPRRKNNEFARLEGCRGGELTAAPTWGGRMPTWPRKPPGACGEREPQASTR